MNSLLNVLLGVAVGTYYAESIRKQVPVLNPTPTVSNTENEVE